MAKLSPQQYGSLAHMELETHAKALEAMADQLVRGSRSSAGCMTREQIRHASRKDRPVGMRAIRYANHLPQVG